MPLTEYDGDEDDDDDDDDEDDDNVEWWIKMIKLMTVIDDTD